MVTEGVVVWTGTLERQSAERERRPAPPLRAEATQIETIYDGLCQCGPSTAVLLARALGLKNGCVSSALYRMVQIGWAEIATEIPPFRTEWGNLARWYRAVPRG
jgi:hypothetical protein